MIHSRIPSAIAIAAMAGLSLSSATAQVVFSESFEAPVVSGLVGNTVPSGGKWIGATNNYGSTFRGLYNEKVQWPTTPPFSTPFGEQAYFLNYINSALTTAVGATGQTLTAGVNYQVTFHAAAATGYASATYRVELVAFGTADDNAARVFGNSGRPGTILAFSTGSVTTNDMSSRFTINFTADGANAHLGKDLGIRILYVGSGSNTSCLYDNIRLIAGHDMNPSPANGENLIAAGNVTLSWTNRPPVSPATTTPVDVWFGSNPAALTQVVDGQLTSSTVVNAPTAGTWHWRVDSYPDGNPNGTPVIGQVFAFTIADTDGDGISDTWENQFFGSSTGANPTADTDADGLTNLQEFTRGTNPNVADTDADGLLDGFETATNTWVNATSTGSHPLIADTDKDGLLDGVETNTGNWVNIGNTGTNPNDPDWDKDGLKDGAETNNGTYVDRLSTGSNPYIADTDGDGAGDWYEATATFTNPNSAAQTSPIPYPLPKPNGSTGATNKPVKVYIIMGQSNATGIGRVSGTLPGSLETIAKREHRFPNLVDASNNWLPRNDVLFRRVSTPGATNAPLAPGQGGSTDQIGPELGFGQVMGWYHDEPVLILKASMGNRSLGGDFLPPGSPRRQFNGSNIAAYGESPAFWPIGTTPVPNSWYAGRQYDACFHNLPDYAVPPASWAPGVTYGRETLIGHNGQIYWCGSGHTSDASTEPGVGANWTTRWNNYDSATEMLANFATFFPQYAAQGYEIGGFVWWQGHFDQGTPNYAPFYQENLVNYINAVRDEFNAPNAPFVVATIGFGGAPLSNKTQDFQTVFNAQMAVQDLPQFAGTVKSVDILKYWRTPAESPKDEDYHYNHNAETYMLVGDAAGRAMLEMQSETTPPSPNPPTFAVAPTAVNANTIGMVATTATDVSSPVRYYFENLTNGTNSGWILSTRWDSGSLPTGVSHTFRFKAKDSKDNETDWSATMSAVPGNDVTAPTPNPLSFTGPITVLGENSLAMAGTPAGDINGVEYQFVCTAGGGPDSAWQASPSFTATGLTPATSYTYIVRARDSIGNTTTDSAPAIATTLAQDLTAPTPSPLTFAIAPSAQGIDRISMTATSATDPSGVEYFFEAVDGGNSSGWQNSPTYTDTDLAPGTTYGYRVRARDKSPAQNVTDWSAVATATTEVPDVTAPLISQLTPLNSATNVAIADNLVITFNEDIAIGTGSITLKNLTDATQTVIAVTDVAQVSVSGPFLTINPSANLLNGKQYAVQIASTAIKDKSDNFFDGILNDTTWSFATAFVGPYYWDGNNDTAGFGTANGTWAAPTAGTATSGWSTSNLGTNVVNGNSIITNTVDTVNFGRTGTGNPGLLGGTINVSGTVNVGTISGGNPSGTQTYTFSGGTINFANVGAFDMGNGATFVFDSQITGAGTSLSKLNVNTTARLNNANNSYIGATIIAGGLQAAFLTNGGLNSSIGASSNAASNLQIGSSNRAGTLSYVGATNATTDRLFTIGNNQGTLGQVTLQSSGGGTLHFTNTGAIAVTTGTIARNLNLGGTNTGENILSPTLTNGAGAVISVTKADAGRWRLANLGNSYTGATTISGGILEVALLANGGSNSSIGASASNPNNLRLSGGTTLRHTGATASSTDRNLALLGSATLDSSGTGTLALGQTGGISGDVTGLSATFATNNATVTVASTDNLFVGMTVSATGAFTGTRTITAINSATSSITLNSNSNITAGTVSLNGGTPTARTLTLTGSNAGANTIAGNLQNSTAVGSGVLGLTKTGSGTWVLSGTNTYTGATTITEGTLTITGPVQATNSITFTGGSLGLDTGFPVTAASAAVNLTNGTIKVTGSTGSASYTLLTAASITGTPVLAAAVPGYALQLSPDNKQLLLVQTVAPDPYVTWAAQIADPNLRDREDDADGDGFDNGQEFLFGTSPVASNGSLTTTEKSGPNLIIRWRELETGAAYTLQQSTALANDWGAASGATIENDGTASGGYQPRKATIPIGSGKLFFRVRGVEN